MKSKANHHKVVHEQRAARDEPASEASQWENDRKGAFEIIFLAGSRACLYEDFSLSIFG